jgi:hypothetical protein
VFPAHELEPLFAFLATDLPLQKFQRVSSENMKTVAGM